MPVNIQPSFAARWPYQRIRYSYSASDIPSLIPSAANERYHLLRSHIDHPDPRPRTIDYHHRTAGAANPGQRTAEAMRPSTENAVYGGRIRRSRSESNMTEGEVFRLRRLRPIRRPEVMHANLSPGQTLLRALRNATEASVDSGIRSIISGWAGGIVLKGVSQVPGTAGVSAIAGALFSLIYHSSSYITKFGHLWARGNYTAADALERARIRTLPNNESSEIAASLLIAQLYIYFVNPNFIMNFPVLNFVSSLLSIKINGMVRDRLPRNFSFRR